MEAPPGHGVPGSGHPAQQTLGNGEALRGNPATPRLDGRVRCTGWSLRPSRGLGFQRHPDRPACTVRQVQTGESTAGDDFAPVDAERP
jgi:hypothetical protein